MLETAVWYVIGFITPVLQATYGAVTFLVPILAKIAFGLFLCATNLAAIWLLLLGLTIFLAPVGEIRRRVSCADPGDEVVTDRKRREFLEIEEIILMLGLPRTYLPELLWQTGVDVCNSLRDSSLMFATDLRNGLVFIAIWPVNKFRNSGLGKWLGLGLNN